MSIANADPADVGMDAKRLGLLRPSIEKEIDSGITDGSIILVARRGKIVWHEAIGFSEKRKNRTAEVGDVLPIMSLTKQLTAALVFRFRHIRSRRLPGFISSLRTIDSLLP
jgi:CubicO group peptidase (beta-lactamase class C family)